eukprot:3779718-Karenia_brevis.AAC.1
MSRSRSRSRNSATLDPDRREITVNVDSTGFWCLDDELVSELQQRTDKMDDLALCAGTRRLDPSLSLQEAGVRDVADLQAKLSGSARFMSNWSYGCGFSPGVRYQ